MPESLKKYAIFLKNYISLYLNRLTVSLKIFDYFFDEIFGGSDFLL